LFRDAVQTADSVENSGAAVGLNWDDYDLVLIFHAGAGAEFDLGYTTTPHDLPSAWMIAEDLDTLGLGHGIPVRVGEPVQGGLLLPETETHEGVQISMTGVMCSLFGHWLGLPALYDNDREDKGRSVVGKWSLMDRGFGNFYGAIPGRLDAWSRSYNGLAGSGGNRSWQLPYKSIRLKVPEVEAFKIPINAHEYFLLSCRLVTRRMIPLPLAGIETAEE
jgi:M6 family metalloprotease-like protein